MARFGEDDTRGLAPGGSGRERYPNAHIQRDWVVEAFNRDMPYDLFVKAQIAGDLLEEAERERAIPGLGFLGGGPGTTTSPIRRWRARTSGTTGST